MNLKFEICAAVGAVGVESIEVGHVRDHAARFRGSSADAVASAVAAAVPRQHQQPTRQDAAHRSRLHRHVRPRSVCGPNHPPIFIITNFDSKKSHFIHWI